MTKRKPNIPLAQSESSGTPQTVDTKSTALGPGALIAEETARMIDEEANKRSAGDAALWYHHRALLEGGLRIYSRDELKFWTLSKHLAQYKEAEQSVIEGWRKFVQTTLQIPRHRQSDDDAIKRAVIIDGCRRAKTKQQVARILRDFAKPIEAFASSGNVEFFRSLGRLLSSLPKSTSLSKFGYTYAMLSQWLTSSLWLMPEKTAASVLAGWNGKESKTGREFARELRQFKDTKYKYRLVSHRPNLIHEIEEDGKLILTAEGRKLMLLPTSIK